MSRIENFLSERYSQLQLPSGNIHWDIHERNVCFDGSGKLTILDLDLMQEGELACDFTRAACMYASEEGNRFSLAPEVLAATVEVLREGSPEITEQEVKLLICRTPLGPMMSPHYFRNQEETFNFLRSLETFVGG